MPRGSNLPSAMTKDFSQVSTPKMQRSVFQRNRTYKTTFDAGLLIPFFLDEILPGDTLQLTANIFARLSTLKFPIMDNVHLDTFYFFVPNRLVWENWEKFQGAQDNPGASIDFEVPQLDAAGGTITFNSETLHDYFGLPIGKAFTQPDMPSALPFRAYNLIWNEWFRAQDLQDSATVEVDDGPDSTNYDSPLRRGKRHDYFTSVLPWPQKGDAVSLPIGTSAPVIGTGDVVGWNTGAGDGVLAYTNDSTGFDGFARMYSSGIGNPAGSAPAGSPVAGDVAFGLSTVAANSGMIADLSTAIAATINDLRYAFAVQQILETDARGGTRYVEILKARWHVISPDFRLQRPEYLGGSTQRVDVRGVPQTSASPASPTNRDAQGNLAAYAQIGTRSGFNKSFVEHGMVIGLVNVRADLTWQQGLHRMWSRRTRYDFYMPELAHLGEQAVLNKEIWMTDNNTTVNNQVFGYQERWAEYRYAPNMITGQFRSDAADSLDAWHLATDYTALPVLNSSFIEDSPPLDRVLAVTDEPAVLFDSFIQARHARIMPVYSVPGLQRL